MTPAISDSNFMTLVYIGPIKAGLKVSDELCPKSGSPIVNVSRVRYGTWLSGLTNTEVRS